MSAEHSQHEPFPLTDGLKIAEFATWTVETQICRECEQIFSKEKGTQQVDRLSAFSSNMFALSCRLFVLQLLHVMETSFASPRSLQSSCIKALYAVLCRLDPEEQPRRDLDAVSNQILTRLRPYWEKYEAKLQTGAMKDMEWKEFDNNTPSAEFAKDPPPHLRKATKVVPKSHHYRLAYCMMLGLETAVRAEDGMRLINSCVYGFAAFQRELEHQMRILGFEPPYPLNHTLNLDGDLSGTEIALETANRLLAWVVIKFNIPSSGTLISPNHFLDGQDVWFEEVSPALFSQIRSVSNVEGSEYAWSVAHRGFKFVEFVTNSKSGETFFFSHDGRFIVKTISDEEAAVLIRMLPGYLSHLREESSLLMRICGLYSARFFIVCLSVFDCGGLGLHAQYDLKGSTKGRKAKEGQTVSKDQDWLAAPPPVELPADDRRRLRGAVMRDAAFLQSYGVLDYSLLVGIHDREASEEGVLCRGVHLLSSIVKTRMLPALRTIRLLRTAVSLGGLAALRDNRRDKDASRRDGKEEGGQTESDSGDEAGAAEARHGRARSEGGRRGSLKHAGGVHTPLARFGGGDGARLVYFVGVVDFLVPWSLKKQAEFAWNSVRGFRRTGSCIPPAPYALRISSFVGSAVFPLRPEERTEQELDADEADNLKARRRCLTCQWLLCCFSAQAQASDSQQSRGRSTPPELKRRLLAPLSPERL